MPFIPVFNPGFTSKPLYALALEPLKEEKFEVGRGYPPRFRHTVNAVTVKRKQGKLYFSYGTLAHHSGKSMSTVEEFMTAYDDNLSGLNVSATYDGDYFWSLNRMTRKEEDEFIGRILGPFVEQSPLTPNGQWTEWLAFEK